MTDLSGERLLNLCGAVLRIGQNKRGKSWRIVMDFDEDGDLTSYWEGALDEHGE